MVRIIINYYLNLLRRITHDCMVNLWYFLKYCLPCSFPKSALETNNLINKQVKVFKNKLWLTMRRKHHLNEPHGQSP